VDDRGLFVKFQKPQEKPKMHLVPLDRRGSHAAHLPQINYMGYELSFRSRRPGGFALWNQMLLAKEAGQSVRSAGHSIISSEEVLVGQGQIILCQLFESWSSATLQPANQMADSVKAKLYG
jgi:hypothetical protein